MYSTGRSWRSIVIFFIFSSTVLIHKRFCVLLIFPIHSQWPLAASPPKQPVLLNCVTACTCFVGGGTTLYSSLKTYPVILPVIPNKPPTKSRRGNRELTGFEKVPRTTTMVTCLKLLDVQILTEKNFFGVKINKLPNQIYISWLTGQEKLVSHKFRGKLVYPKYLIDPNNNKFQDCQHFQRHLNPELLTFSNFGNKSFKILFMMNLNVKKCSF